MQEFYELNRQIDLWEEDLREEIRSLKQETQKLANSEAEIRRLMGFYSIYSESLNEEFEICLN